MIEYIQKRSKIVTTCNSSLLIKNDGPVSAYCCITGGDTLGELGCLTSLLSFGRLKNGQIFTRQGFLTFTDILPTCISILQSRHWPMIQELGKIKGLALAWMDLKISISSTGLGWPWENMIGGIHSRAEIMTNSLPNWRSLYYLPGLIAFKFQDMLLSSCFTEVGLYLNSTTYIKEKYYREKTAFKTKKCSFIRSCRDAWSNSRCVSL